MQKLLQRFSLKLSFHSCKHHLQTLQHHWYYLFFSFHNNIEKFYVFFFNFMSLASGYCSLFLFVHWVGCKIFFFKSLIYYLGLQIFFYMIKITFSIAFFSSWLGLYGVEISIFLIEFYGLLIFYFQLDYWGWRFMVQQLSSQVEVQIDS